MPIDDLWYLSKRGPDKKRLPSKRHGRGKRWRVRYTDAAGEPREKLFERKVDADAFDLECRSGVAAEVKATRETDRLTFAEYAQRWRESRESGWATETRRRIPQNLRKHLLPVFGEKSIRSINLTDVLAWLGRLLDDGTPKSSVSLYFGLFKTIMNAAVIDKVIPDNPCNGVKLAQILRGLSRAPKWVPTNEQVLRLAEVVPRRYRAAIWLGAGEGLRLGEVLGMEAGPRCADFDNGDLHVVQQMRHSPEHFGGFYLSTPKSGSAGTVDLDAVVAEELAAHLSEVGPVEFELPDITTGERQTRRVAILFTSARGKLLTDTYWSELWADWREAAGWPKEGTFHSLRHFFATTLMSNGVEPQEVQKALRHANLRITLETYVHWLPKKDRPRGLIGDLLRKEGNQRRGAPTGQDRS
ncbi:site-specific integrase [Verrucosispora sp. FIM060022]|uniref:tyrosine-type recombinase/integrase n=1 Tax=Verrucosispora sp. FIM060022 TaxID=1479020 RepID=UPI000F89555E|nr:site-specific integrase [Verrucosispora sp. FIM060022]RUL90971.1 site-specific integrase [Verrucosispora sp. FIM060022]